MRPSLSDQDWVPEIARQYSLSEDLVRRLLEEFLAATDLTVEEYVSQRHLALQEAGWRNQKIFLTIQAEVAEGRFRSEALSERRIRRMIYG